MNGPVAIRETPSEKTYVVTVQMDQKITLGVASAPIGGRHLSRYREPLESSEVSRNWSAGTVMKGYRTWRKPVFHDRQQRHVRRGGRLSCNGIKTLKKQERVPQVGVCTWLEGSHYVN